MQGNTFTIKSLSIIPSFNQLESGRKGQMQEPQIFAVIAQILHIQIFCTYKYLLCLIVRIEKERFLVLMPKGGEPLWKWVEKKKTKEFIPLISIFIHSFIYYFFNFLIYIDVITFEIKNIKNQDSKHFIWYDLFFSFL